MTKIQRYGVGFGPSLMSRRVGNLDGASMELRKLIRGGLDPRRLQILPVRQCGHCKGKGERHFREGSAICGWCQSFGFVVDKALSGLINLGKGINAEAYPADKTTGAFMSKPTTTAADRRTWLIRILGESFPALVRVYPTKTKPLFSCDCERAKEGKTCGHEKAARDLDGRKFNTENNDNGK